MMSCTQMWRPYDRRFCRALHVAIRLKTLDSSPSHMRLERQVYEHKLWKSTEHKI